MIKYKQLRNGGERMGQDEKKLARKLAETVKALPSDKREYLIGFAEGVAAVTENQESSDKDAPTP